MEPVRPPTPHLRPATDADREFLWRLHRDTMRPYVDATWGWDDGDQRRRFDAAFDPDRLAVVAVEREPVGTLRVERRPGEVFLAAIEVAPAWQGRGIGTRLILDVVEGAGRLPVALRVLKANPARALYERLGFAVDGETATHHTMRRSSR